MPSVMEKMQEEVLDGEKIADCMMLADKVNGYVLVAETSKVEAIEP
jgi:hypothetical protein